MNDEELQITVICLNPGSNFERGRLVLPNEFTRHYSEKLPEKVYLNVPSGASWHGIFVKETGSIEGLDYMISFYSLKESNLPVLQYIGGPNFNLRLFNCYAVEIDYSLGVIPTNRFVVGPANSISRTGKEDNNTEVETDRLNVAFHYSAYNHSGNSCELKIRGNHLLKERYNKILSKSNMTKLNIDLSMTYIYIGFEKWKWQIQIVKDGKHIKFGKGWNDFAKITNLEEGDICIFHDTTKKNWLQVAIFKKKDILQWNPPIGEELFKSRSLFFHMASEDFLKKGEIDLPRVFIEKYGKNLEDTLTLWMADHNVWIVRYSRNDNCMFGMERLQNHYSVRPDSVFLFHYFGKSTFYMSIVDSNGVDILNWIHQKLLLKDVVMENSLRDFNILSSSLDMSEGEDSMDAEDFSESVENGANVMHDDGHGTEDGLGSLLGATNFENDSDKFSVKMVPSHFDDKCHGVYLPRSLKSFYKTWKKRSMVTLCYRGKFWKVKANASGKTCRLGKGWSDFVSENNFNVGQQIHFEYVDAASMFFNVTD